MRIKLSSKLFLLYLCFALFLLRSNACTFNSVEAADNIAGTNLNSTDDNDSLKCLEIFSIPSKEQCEFAERYCGEYKLGTINYFKIYYCGSTSEVTRKVVFFPFTLLILAFLFLALGIVAGEYLCPNLSAISNFLQIPDNISGMTLLAFGNDSPDIMSTYSSFSTGNASLAIGELIGAAFFVTCFVVGTVSIIHPFSLLPKEQTATELPSQDNTSDVSWYRIRNSKLVFLRDVCFFVLSLLLIMVFLLRGRFTKSTLILLTGLYIFYTAMIVSWQHIYDRTRRNLEATARARSLYDDERPLRFANDNLEFENEYTFNPAVLSNFEFGSVLSGLTKSRSIQISPESILHYSDNDDDTQYETRLQNLDGEEIDSETEGQLRVHGEEDSLREETRNIDGSNGLTHLITLIFKIVSAPIKGILCITVPKVTTDFYHTEHKFRFNELASLLSSALLSGTIIQYALFKQNSLRSSILQFGLSLLLTACTYYNMIISGHQMDLLKMFLSAVGFMASISWISFIAEELINNLKFISVLTKLSEAILGLTVFAIGNSVGDLISDIVVARLGYPLMALAACLGGPLMNMLLSIGVNGLIVGGRVSINTSFSLYSSCVFIMINLIFMLVYVPRNNWKFDRLSGTIMISVWCFGTFVNVLIELFN